VIGVLDIQSTEIEAFKQDDIDLFTTLADQVALAIQNARLIDDSKNYIDQMESITGDAIQKGWRERMMQGKSVYRYTPAGLVTIEKGTNDHLGSDKPNQLSIPITLRGRQIGTIALKRRENAPWLDSDATLAKEISDQVGLALENARLLDEAQQRANREQIISDLSSTFGRYTDSTALLQAAIRELHQLPNISEVSVIVSPPEKPTISDGKLVAKG
jgi:GAF domain-containing protein